MKFKRIDIDIPPYMYLGIQENIMENKPFNFNKIIKGELVNGSPFLKLKYREIELDAMIDTGAKKSMLGRKIVPLLKECYNIEKTGEAGINNPAFESMVILDTFLLEFKMLGIDELFTDEFVEMPNDYLYPILLGTDFLMRCKEFHYMSDNKTFELFL
jgi:hypothetical protein